MVELTTLTEMRFSDKSELESHSFKVDVDTVMIDGYSTAGDGGGGLYKKVAAEPSHEGKAQSALGTWWELVGDVVNLEQFGGGTGATGAVNATALGNAWAFLLANDGGVIQCRAGNYDLDNVSVADATKRIAIRGAGPRLGTTFTPTGTISGGSPETWVLTVGDGTDTQFVELSDFCIQGDTDIKTAINGIKVNKSNTLVLKRVLVRHLTGHGIYVIRPHNSEINGVTTAHCGSLTHSKFAQVYTGDDVGNTVGNDIRFVGKCTTEQDKLGIQLAYLANVFGGHIKLHGDSTARRTLQIYRVRGFDLTVAPTLGYSGDGMIYVGDAQSVDTPTDWLPPVVSGGSALSQGQIDIIPHGNLENHGPVGTEAMVEIDTGNSASILRLTGTMPPIAGSDYRYLHFTATTSTARFDSTGLRTSATDTTKWALDERTVDERYSAAPFTQLSGVHPGIRTQHRGSSTWQQIKSELALYEIAANTYGPQARLVGACFDNSADNTIFRGWQSASWSIPTFAAGFLIPPFTFPLWEDPGSNTAEAIIRKVMIGVRGAVAWDASNHWLMRLDQNNATAVEDFYISTDGTFGSEGAGHPDRRISTTNGSLEYWNTPATLTKWGVSHQLQMQAVKVGTPSSDPSALQVTIYYDVVV